MQSSSVALLPIPDPKQLEQRGDFVCEANYAEQDRLHLPWPSFTFCAPPSIVQSGINVSVPAPSRPSIVLPVVHHHHRPHQPSRAARGVWSSEVGVGIVRLID
jgi:hypothetical protein